MLSHRTAAELDKLTDEISELVHVMIPAERRVYMTVGILVHRSSRATEALHPAHAPPRTRIEETILDLTETAATLDEVVSWVACGLGRRRTVPAKLRLAMEQRATLRWRRELAELLSDEIRGVHSALEHRYVRDVERPHSLPRGERQALVKRNGRSQYRDVLYKVHCLLVELDGLLVHPAESRWRDIRRDNAAAAEGFTTLRYGWLDITKDPCRVAAQVATLLSQRGCTQFHPCSPNCPVGLIKVRKPSS